MEQLIKLGGLDAANRSLLVDQPFGHHLDRHAYSRGTGPFAGPGLEHPQLALLNRELNILHITIVAFQPLGDRF